MGAGKSYLGKQIALQMGCSFIDLDQVIELAEGLTIQSYFDRNGEDSFRILERNTLLRLINSQTDFVMACGGGTPCFFDNIQQMKQAGKVIWLNPSEPVLINRLKKNQANRPLLASVTPGGLSAFIVEQLSNRRNFYQQANWEIKDDQPEISLVINWIKYGQD